MKRATGLSHHGQTAQNQHEDWSCAAARRATRVDVVETLRGRRRSASSRALDGATPRSASSFGDSFDTNRAHRVACAELLIEAGAVVTASVCEGLIIGPP